MVMTMSVKRRSSRLAAGDGPVLRCNARLRAILEDIEIVLSAVEVPVERRLETAQVMVRNALEHRGDE